VSLNSERKNYKERVSLLACPANHINKLSALVIGKVKIPITLKTPESCPQDIQPTEEYE